MPIFAKGKSAMRKRQLQNRHIVSYEMQIINNKALHLNSTLKFTKTFTKEVRLSLSGEKWLLELGWGILHITNINTLSLSLSL